MQITETSNWQGMALKLWNAALKGKPDSGSLPSVVFINPTHGVPEGTDRPTIAQIVIDADDRERHYELLVKMLRETKPDAFIYISEAWMGSGSSDEQPSKDPNRRDGLILSAMHRDGGALARTAVYSDDAGYRESKDAEDARAPVYLAALRGQQVFRLYRNLKGENQNCGEITLPESLTEDAAEERALDAVIAMFKARGFDFDNDEDREAMRKNYFVKSILWADPNAYSHIIETKQLGANAWWPQSIVSGPAGVITEIPEREIGQGAGLMRVRKLVDGEDTFGIDRVHATREKTTSRTVTQ